MADLPSFISTYWDSFLTTLSGVANAWVAVQLAIILVCYAAATAVNARLEPAIEDRIRGISGQPRLLRILVVGLRRLKWLIFVGLLWAVVGVMTQATWPSRSYFIRLAAELATSWVLISLLARLIRNRTLARIVSAIAWVVAALAITGYLGPLAAALDSAGVDFAGFRLSLLIVLKGIALLALLLWAAIVASNLIEQRLSLLELEPTLVVLLGKAIKGGLLVVACLIALQAIGIEATALTVFSGAFGLGIAFGLQKVASNLISGFIILMDRSIKPGDVIAVGETFGWITSLRARYVSVSTREGIEYLIPNETFITERVVNMSFSNRNIRLDVNFGVSYDSDPHAVRKLACEAVAELPRIETYPAPVCHITGFGDSSVDFILRFWIRDPEKGVTNIKGTVFLALWDAFKANGIAIPYPHRDVILRRARPVEAQETSAAGAPLAHPPP